MILKQRNYLREKIESGKKIMHDFKMETLKNRKENMFDR